MTAATYPLGSFNSPRRRLSIQLILRSLRSADTSVSLAPAYRNTIGINNAFAQKWSSFLSCVTPSGLRLE